MSLHDMEREMFGVYDESVLMDAALELAWAAGFFDGEGSVSVRHDKRPGRKPTLQLDIEQVDPRPLRRFAQAVGYRGSITKRDPRGGGRKAIYRIAMGENTTLNTIGALWDYLSEPKREQYKRALEETWRNGPDF